MIQAELQHIINNKTKPLGALGMLEDLALQLGILQNSTTPAITDPHIVVFAADHGIAATGLVNPYPQAVTAQMVKNFLSGGAAINVFCRQHNIALTIADVGVNNEWTATEMAQPNFVVQKAGMGTANYLTGMAMTATQCAAAMAAGKNIVQQITATGCNTIGFGEMGIGNTSSAALIMHSITGLPLEQCVGRGTGISDAGLQTKLHTLQTAAQLHNIESLQNSPIELLTAVGGFELAALCGAYLQAASAGMLILVDGFIATAALLIAQKINNSILKNSVFSHCSTEQGHRAMLQHLGATPLLQLNLRLGEGTGAALALPLLQSASLFLSEMASFSSAGVATKTTA